MPTTALITSYATVIVAIIAVAIGLYFVWRIRQRIKRAVIYTLDNLETVLKLILSVVVTAVVIADTFFVELSEKWPSLFPKLPEIIGVAVLLVLGLNAVEILKDRGQRNRLIKEVRLATEGVADIHVYTSWNESKVQDIIASAQRSILIIDSWFDEAPYFTHLIEKAKQHVGAQIEVTVCMADKEGDNFGAQRLKEIGQVRLHEIFNRVYHKVANMGTSNDMFRRVYEQYFDDSVSALLLYLGDPKVKLRVFAHRLMPGIRMTVVDDTIYLFSWFPIGSVSAKNVCFCVSTNSVSTRSQLTAKVLRTQIDAIMGPDNCREVIGDSRGAARSI